MNILNWLFSDRPSEFQSWNTIYMCVCAAVGVYLYIAAVVQLLSHG